MNLASDHCQECCDPFGARLLGTQAGHTYGPGCLAGDNLRRACANYLATGSPNVPLWCNEHLEPYCPRHASGPRGAA